jgi:hypothetical protein
VVTDPLGRWGRGIVAEVVDEKVVQPNGGSSLRDVVDALAVQQETLLAWTSEAEGRQSDWAEYVGQQFDTMGSRMDMLCDEVGRLKHERKDVA